MDPSESNLRAVGPLICIRDNEETRSERVERDLRHLDG